MDEPIKKYREIIVYVIFVFGTAVNFHVTAVSAVVTTLLAMIAFVAPSQPYE